MLSTRLSTVSALLLAALALLQPTDSAHAGKRYALIVGVKTYRPGQPLPALSYTENDADGLAAVLKAGGYDVTLMTQTVGRVEGKGVFNPLSDYIRDQVSAILDNPFLNEDDMVLVALAGHGVQYELVDDGGNKTPKFYFCPADADVARLKTANEINDRNRLLDLGELYTALKNCRAGGKLLLVDACRNDPTKPGLARALASATLPALPPPPGGTAAFFSCSAHQQAFEDQDLQHGVFFHHVIEALRGDADTSTKSRPADGEITLAELSEHVSASTYDLVRKKYQGAKQAPELKGEFRVSIPLITVARVTPVPPPTPQPSPPPPPTRSTVMPFERAPQTRAFTGELVNTGWSIRDSQGDAMDVYFLDGDQLWYDAGRGLRKNGTWTQTGSTLSISINEGFSTMEGKLSGKQISGQGASKLGTSWTWTASPQ